jgi:hypothetical protein
MVIVEGLKQGKENVEKMAKPRLHMVSIHLSSVVIFISTNFSLKNLKHD